MLDFNAIVNAAYSKIAANKASAPDDVGGKLDGRVVHVPSRGNLDYDAIFNRTGFLDAVKEKFGEEVAKDVEKLVDRSDGSTTKSLSARTIVVVDEYLTTPARTMSRLSDFLERAVMTDVASVTAKEVDEAIEGLELSQEDVEKLGELQKVAETAFDDVLTKTGAQVVDAIKNGSADNPDFVRAAVTAQMDLADKLTDIALNLESGYEGIEALRDKALARATELNCLAAELVQISDDLKEKSQEEVGDRANMLDKVAMNMLPKKAFEMHGNADALQAMEKYLEPLMRRVEAIKTGAAAGSGRNFVDAEGVLDDIYLAKRALLKAAQDGIVYDNSVWHPNAEFLESVVKVLDETAADVHKLTDEFMKEGLRVIANHYKIDSRNLRFIDKARMSEECKNFFRCRTYAEEIGVMMQQYNGVSELMDYLVRVPSAENLKWVKDRIACVRKYVTGKRDEINKCCNLMDDLNIYFKKRKSNANDKDESDRLEILRMDLDDMNENVRKEIEEIAEQFLIGSWRSIIDNSGIAFLERMVARCEFVMSAAGQRVSDRMNDTDRLLKMAIERNLPLDFVIEAMAWGATDDMIDFDISDRNRVGNKQLSDGKVPKFTELKYRTSDGNVKDYVFMDEGQAERSMNKIRVTQSGYGELQSIAHLSVASHKVAELLGTPDIVVDAKVGRKSGKFGLFVERAPGVSFMQMKENDGKDFGLASKEEVAKLDNNSFRKLAGNFMRASTDLEWNDWLTGQSYRHSGNYMFTVGADQTVSLKAIDNGTSFPSYRLGMTKFNIQGQHLDRLLSSLQKNGVITEADINYLDEKDGVEIPDEPRVIIDIAKAPEMAWYVQKAVGFRVAAKPVAISRSMYDTLMALNGNQEMLRTALGPHLQDDALEATVERFVEMVEHAKLLNDNGMVLDDEQWQDHNVQNAIDQAQRDGRLKDSAGKHVYSYDRGFYLRDFLGFYGRELPK